MKRAYFLSSIIAICGVITIFASRKYSVFTLVIIVLAAGELFYGFTKFNPFVPSAYIFPPNDIFTYLQQNAGINRYWGYGTAHIEANFATQYRVYAPDGTDPLNLRWYNSFIQSSKNGILARTFTRSTRSDAYVYPGYGATDLPLNRYRLRVLDTLGVRYILDRAENPKDTTTYARERFTPVWRANNWTIYENLRAAPRYFLTSNVAFYADDTEFERLFFDPAFDPKTMILLPKDSPIPRLKSTPTHDGVELTVYTPNKIEFRVVTPTPKLLFLSDTYDAGWKSFIDGRMTKTLKANYALRAVYVPEGSHVVHMIYRPHEYTYGAVLSGIGILMLAVYLTVTNPKKA